MLSSCQALQFMCFETIKNVCQTFLGLMLIWRSKWRSRICNSVQNCFKEANWIFLRPCSTMDHELFTIFIWAKLINGHGDDWWMVINGRWLSFNLCGSYFWFIQVFHIIGIQVEWLWIENVFVLRAPFASSDCQIKVSSCKSNCLSFIYYKWIEEDGRWVPSHHCMINSNMRKVNILLAFSITSFGDN